MTTLALIGDYSPEVLAHRAIPQALAFAADALGTAVAPTWVPTAAVNDAARQLAGYSGIWLVPGSPYRNMDGALRAVTFARTTGRPFLGTCGGFQHALIEIARHVANLASADHGETNPDGDTLVVTRLACSLIDATGIIRFTPGSVLHRAYGAETAREGYRCSYGMNPAFRSRLEAAGLRFTARDEAGEIRGGELPSDVHPFFAGTLFQPERAALRGETPPLVLAFVRAAVARAQFTVSPEPKPIS